VTPTSGVGRDPDQKRRKGRTGKTAVTNTLVLKAPLLEKKVTEGIGSAVQTLEKGLPAPLPCACLFYKENGKRVTEGSDKPTQNTGRENRNPPQFTYQSQYPAGRTEKKKT